MVFTMMTYDEKTKTYEISARRDENSDWHVIDEVSSQHLAKRVCMKLEENDKLRNAYIAREEE